MILSFLSGQFRTVRAVALTLGVVAVTGSPAHAIDKLYAPYVEKGEWEAEYFGTKSFDGNDAKDDAQKHQLSIGYGVTDYWKTEVYGSFEKAPQDHVTFDSWEWENIFQFTKPGEYLVDAGGSLAYEWTPSSNIANKVEARLLLAKDTGKFSHLLNLIAEKEVGSGPRDQLEGGFIWSSRYNYNASFQPGVEINSDFGEFAHTGKFNDQSHYVGPVAYGKLPLPFANEDESLKYRVGYLFGISDAASNGQLIAQIEYELEF